MGPDVDLAALEVIENADEFFADLTPVAWSYELPPLQSRVTVRGYPLGGNAQSVTEGVVSRVDCKNYRLGATSSISPGRSLVVQIDAAINETVAANGFTNAYVRPIAWRGSEQMGVSAQKTKPHLAVAAWEWGSYFSEELHRKGLRLTIAPWRRPAPYTAPTKSKAAGLYMICTMSKHAAEDAGYNDALMLDWRGQVAEATGANVFFMKDGVLHTPTPDCFLDGITRRTVMKLAQRRNIEVVERTIWPEEMESFEQAFLTGSAAEVTPLGEIGPWRFEVGAMTQQLAKDYSDHVNGRLVL
jgi:branched-chain amino acid aminotransferase